MKCIRCQNEDPKYFYLDKDVWYCRKCIAFGRIDVGEKPSKKNYRTKKHDVHYHLPYSLTLYQKNAQQKLLQFCKEKRNVLVYASTGAGKTEITMKLIETYLNEGKKVGVAISRRQVVLEIRERMASAFSSLHVIAVCEGHTKVVDADLIICTMHQLYRYYQTFDLLIMDEVDAFPYRGNEVLESIAHHSCKGEIVYLSATPDAKMLEEIQKGELEVVQLFARPHGYPLCVPKVYILPFLVQVLFMLIFLIQQKRKKKKTLVFVPTITMATFYGKWLKYFFLCDAITSKTKNKDELALKMRKGELDFLFATTILERGITIPKVDVLILSCNHVVFDEASLIQIAGRVGRSMDHPYGTCIFLAQSFEKEMKKCIERIKWMNKESVQ